MPNAGNKEWWLVVAAAVLSAWVIFCPRFIDGQRPTNAHTFVLGEHEIASWGDEADPGSVTPNPCGIFRRDSRKYVPGDVVKALALNFPVSTEFIMLNDGKWHVLHE